MTDIAKLGEFGLIRHLTEGLKPKTHQHYVVLATTAP